jgi:hypothetical protein
VHAQYLSIGREGVLGMAAMGLKTALKCPHCNQNCTTNQPVRPGMPIRCPHCRSVFEIPPSENGAEKPPPAAGDPSDKLLYELVEEDNRPTTKLLPREVDMRTSTESIEKLPPRGAGPAPTPKKPALERKPLPFGGPRTMMAAGSLAVAVVVGYLFIRWFGNTASSLDPPTNKAGQNRAAKTQGLADLHAKPKNPMGTVAAAPSTGVPGSATIASSRTPAPQTEKIGNVVVGVPEAKLVTGGGQTGDEYLVITLRITNLSAKPFKYVSWSDPAIKVTLTDQYHNYYNRKASPAEASQEIPPDRTITDTLQFEKPLNGAVLALDLPISDQKFEFSLPATFIQRVSLANVEAGAAAPAPAPISAPAPAAEPEPPYSAERDPQLIADVKAAYDEAMKRVEARVLGMTTSSADRVRKSEKEKIIKTIATKLDMTVDQVLSMISSP